MNPVELPAHMAITAVELVHVVGLEREARHAWLHARCDALHAAGRVVTPAVRESLVANADGLAEVFDALVERTNRERQR